MPRDLLLSEVRKYSFVDAITIEELAEKFKVSLTAMLIRIEHLSVTFEWREKPIRIDMASFDALKNHLLQVSSGKKQTVVIKRKVSKKHLAPKQMVFSQIAPFYPEAKSPEVVRVIRHRLAQMGLVDAARGNSPIEVLRRPFVIEFAGTPNSGKDTQIEIISEYLRDIRGYKVKVIEEGYRTFRVNNNPKYRPYFMLGSTLINLVEIEYNPHGYDVFIINRALFDNLAFLHLYHSQGYLTKKELTTHAASLRVKNLTRLEDIVFLLNISPQESLKREKSYPGTAVSALAQELDNLRPSEGSNSLINDDGLTLLNKCYDIAYMMYRNSFVIHRLNGIDKVLPEKISLELMKQVDSNLYPITTNKPILLRKLRPRSTKTFIDIPQLCLPGL